MTFGSSAAKSWTGLGILWKRDLVEEFSSADEILGSFNGGSISCQLQPAFEWPACTMEPISSVDNELSEIKFISCTSFSFYHHRTKCCLRFQTIQYVFLHRSPSVLHDSGIADKDTAEIRLCVFFGPRALYSFYVATSKALSKVKNFLQICAPYLYTTTWCSKCFGQQPRHRRNHFVL